MGRMYADLNSILMISATLFSITHIYKLRRKRLALNVAVKKHVSTNTTLADTSLPKNEYKTSEKYKSELLELMIMRNEDGEPDEESKVFIDYYNFYNGNTTDGDWSHTCRGCCKDEDDAKDRGAKLASGVFCGFTIKEYNPGRFGKQLPAIIYFMRMLIPNNLLAEVIGRTRFEEENERIDAAYCNMTAAQKLRAEVGVRLRAARSFCLNPTTRFRLCVASILYRITDAIRVVQIKKTASLQQKKYGKHSRTKVSMKNEGTQSELKSPTCEVSEVVHEALSKLWEFLQMPLEDGLGGIAASFWPDGHDRSEMFQYFQTTAHICGSNLYRRFVIKEDVFPDRDFDVLGREATDPLVVERETKLRTSSECCLEPGVELPVKEALQRASGQDVRCVLFQETVQVHHSVIKVCTIQEECEHAQQKRKSGGFVARPKCFGSQASHMVVDKISVCWYSRGGRNLMIAPKVVSNATKSMVNGKKAQHSKPNHAGSTLFGYYAMKMTDDEKGLPAKPN